jgi:hypothetical protein
MAAQQTLKASLIQAERSSDVSATALEQDSAVIITAVTEASILGAVSPFKLCPPFPLLRQLRKRKRPQPQQLWHPLGWRPLQAEPQPPAQ